jgi:hypothetical protein
MEPVLGKTIMLFEIGLNSATANYGSGSVNSPGAGKRLVLVTVPVRRTKN